jgi:membrane protease YdiL (CAAX protease family)
MLMDAGAPVQFMFVLLSVLGGWVLFQMAGLLTAMLIWGMGWSELSGLLSGEVTALSVQVLKYIQGVTSFGMFGIAALYAAWAIDPKPAGYLRLTEKPGIRQLLLTSVLAFAVLPMSNLLGHLNTSLELPQALDGMMNAMQKQEARMDELMESFLNVRGTGALLVNLLIIAFIPSIVEELVFRGLIQRILIQWTRSVTSGILISALVFGVLHFQFLSLLPRVVLGIVLGYLFHFTRNLYLPVLMHFLNNAAAVIFYHFYYAGSRGEAMEEIGTPGHALYLGLLSIVLSFGVLMLIRRGEKGGWAEGC